MPYGYITKLGDKLTREHVRYNNRYGIAIAAEKLSNLLCK